MYKTLSGFSGSVVFEKSAVKVSYSYSLDSTASFRKCRIFGGKMFEISQKLHGGDGRHIKVRKQISLKIDR